MNSSKGCRRCGNGTGFNRPNRSDAPWAFLVTERLLSANAKSLSGFYVMPDASFNFNDVDLKDEHYRPALEEGMRQQLHVRVQLAA